LWYSFGTVDMHARGKHSLSALATVAGLALVVVLGTFARAQDIDHDTSVAARTSPRGDDAVPAKGEDAPAAAATPDALDEPLRVVVAGSAPFVVGAGGTDGLAVDIWAAIASELGLSFELTTAPTVDDALGRVESGEADVAVGPISITADRAQRVAFTQPYFQAHLSVAATPQRSWFARLRPFLSVAFLSGIGGLCMILLIVGTLIWLAERKTNPDQFPRRVGAGIGNGVWMALVTMTTVGYGDRVPTTTTGRVVTGVWMLIAMLIAGSLIAFMSTALTLSQIGGHGIKSMGDLRDERVAVVAGTTSEAFVARMGGRPVAADDLAAAAALVQSNDVAGLVFDRPAVQHYLQNHPSSTFVLSEARYEPTGYGFAIGLTSALRQRLDIAILQLQRTGRIATVTERWLGRD
jgi:polar amino acid transport system substrate-binding protein